MNVQQPSQQPQQIQINPNDCEDFSCECGSLIFSKIIRLKKLSILQSPTGKEELIPIEFLICVKCGKSITP